VALVEAGQLVEADEAIAAAGVAGQVVCAGEVAEAEAGPAR